MATVFVETLAVAEPLLAILVEALHDCVWIVDATVGAGMWWQIVEVVGLHFLTVLPNCSHRSNHLAALHSADGTRNL